MKMQELIDSKKIKYLVARDGTAWVENSKKYRVKIYYLDGKGDKRVIKFLERGSEADFPYFLVRMMYLGKLPWTDDVDMCCNCGGKGRLDHYSHIANGVCFKCEGKRILNEFPIVRPINNSVIKG